MAASFLVISASSVSAATVVTIIVTPRSTGHVFRTKAAIVLLSDGETDLVIVHERFACNSRRVDKEVRCPVVWSDESKALAPVKELHGTGQSSTGTIQFWGYAVIFNRFLYIRVCGFHREGFFHKILRGCNLVWSFRASGGFCTPLPVEICTLEPDEVDLFVLCH